MQTQIVNAIEDCEFRGQELHVLAREAPSTAAYVPAPQSVHVVDPVTVLHFPPTHAVHANPFASVYPALHTHWMKAVLVTAEFEPTGQAVQVEFPVLVL
jgi:hypothetical protein